GLNEFIKVRRRDAQVALPPTAVVPYGASTFTFPQGTPVKGRILFVGTAELRKGIHYLAEAAVMLQTRCKEIEICVAGVASERLRARREVRALHFLGYLSRDQLVRELMRADVFVLPSLAEGSAGAVYEAMAAGVPAIVTHSVGSVVSN